MPFAYAEADVVEDHGDPYIAMATLSGAADGSGRLLNLRKPHEDLRVFKVTSVFATGQRSWGVQTEDDKYFEVTRRGGCASCTGR